MPRKLVESRKPFRQGDHYLVPLTKNLFAKIDEADAERIGQYLWCASREGRDTKWYAVRFVTETLHNELGFRCGTRKRKIRMHHVVLGLDSRDLPKDHVVDHDNHDSLDNRRKNLAVITQRENMEKSFNWRKKPVEPFL